MDCPSTLLDWDSSAFITSGYCSCSRQTTQFPGIAYEMKFQITWKLKMFLSKYFCILSEKFIGMLKLFEILVYTTLRSVAGANIVNI